jgi:hypothetical protein
VVFSIRACPPSRTRRGRHRNIAAAQDPSRSWATVSSISAHTPRMLSLMSSLSKRKIVNPRDSTYSVRNASSVKSWDGPSTSMTIRGLRHAKSAIHTPIGTCRRNRAPVACPRIADHNRASDHGISLRFVRAYLPAFVVCFGRPIPSRCRTPLTRSHAWQGCPPPGLAAGAPPNVAGAPGGRELWCVALSFFFPQRGKSGVAGMGELFAWMVRLAGVVALGLAVRRGRVAPLPAWRPDSPFVSVFGWGGRPSDLTQLPLVRPGGCDCRWACRSGAGFPVNA